MQASRFSQWSLASLCIAVAGLCFWAALVLPWRSWTTFASFATLLGLAHCVTAAAAALGRPATRRAWRVQSALSVAFVLWLGWNTLMSGSYIAGLYGGLGKGVAIALGLGWLLVALLFVPLATWCVASTGGLNSPRGIRLSALLLPVIALLGVWQSRQAAAGQPLAGATADVVATATSLAPAIPPANARGPKPRERRSLMTSAPGICPAPPAEANVTAFVVYRTVDNYDTAVHHECLQAGNLAELQTDLTQRLAKRASPGPITIDVVTRVRELEHLAPVVDGLLLRPGIDGVCHGERCLMPWQLLALDVFTATQPLPVIPELRFGFDPFALRRLLGAPMRSPGDVRGLQAVQTHAYVADDEGVLHPLSRMKTTGPALTRKSLRAGKGAAERYILASIGPDGRFAYRVDPFADRLSFAGFSLARQAGTTLVVCELAEDRERAREVATAALSMLASVARPVGQGAAIYYPREKPVEQVGLGDTALATIAFLSCRNLVGDRFDADINHFTRFLLNMQRSDGGFYPRAEVASGAPVPGPDPLYAVGQAVFALTLLEDLVANYHGPVEFAEHNQVRQAVETAMNYVANDYWQGFMADFFYLEENWHCLAARASLGHHRHAGYEQFCLDYVTYKRRVILDETSDVAPELIGSYGFGNVLLPHNTGSSGFGEASAAALAIAEARGEQRPDLARGLELALGFLLHQQWTDLTCFACSTQYPTVGGFSEHMGSPHIRIDYVQHAMAAMGHGGRQLGLLP